MRPTFFCLLLFLFAAACGDGSGKPVDEKVAARLRTTMEKYLYDSHKLDTSKVTYEVKKVFYFETKEVYVCEFNVHVAVPQKIDTTGIMTADISKDFLTVKRKS